MITLLVLGIVAFLSIRLRKINTKLREFQTARDKFYTIIAHDLRSPINNLNDLEGLLNEQLREGQMQEIDKVTEQIEKMRHETQLLINNLFEWGTNQYFTPNAEEPLQKQDVVQMLQTICQNYLPLTEVKKVDLSAQLPTSLWHNIAPKSFLIVVRNLLDNAIKNTSTGGKVSMSIDSNNYQQLPKFTLSISDTGKGITPDQLHYLQEIFSGKIKPDVGLQGLGMGMVLIHHFVQKNKATLTIESNVGKGTCFKLVW